MSSFSFLFAFNIPGILPNVRIYIYKQMRGSKNESYCSIDTLVRGCLASNEEMKVIQRPAKKKSTRTVQYYIFASVANTAVGFFARSSGLGLTPKLGA